MSDMVLIIAFAAFAGFVALVLVDAAMRAKAAYGQLSRDIKRSDQLADVFVKIEATAKTRSSEAAHCGVSRKARVRRVAMPVRARQPKLRAAA